MKNLLINRYKYALLLVIALSFVAMSLGKLIADLPRLWLEHPDYAVKVLDRNGENLRFFTTIDGFWRFPANLSQIDPKFINALIEYEDKRFYSHFGVDVWAVLRAIKQLLFTARVVSGASTLSMQTIRLLSPRPRTLVNKIREIIQAIQMESDLSKQQILSIYLTLAPYGGNIQGIEAASYFYFGKTAHLLNYSEIALLIALPQSPERRRPDRFRNRAVIARNAVLLRQLNKQSIAADDYQIAIQQAIPLKRKQTPFFAPHLSQQLHQRYPSKQLIRSSIDLALQILVKQKVTQYQNTVLKGSNFSGQSLAVLVVNNTNREVLAHIGSGDFFNDSQIDLSRVIRSPGSTLKPFIYGYGFEKKLFHPLTQVMDQRLRYDDGYAPENFDQRYFGEVTIEQALLKSLNIPAVKALNIIGVSAFIQRLNTIGINLVLQNAQIAGLGIALGGSGLSLESLVAMYSSLPNAGKYLQLVYLPTKYKIQKKKLLSVEAASYIDNILKKMPQENCIRLQCIGYKTGTSYGYRDAWSIGYNVQYTIGVWVGRIDGGFTHQQTGSQVASPLLKQLFAVLPIKNSTYYNLNLVNPGFLKSYQQLPQHLRWLGNKSQQFKQNLPYILYPLDGSQIEFTEVSTENIVQLSLKARGGTPPYFWIIDGLYLHSAIQSNNNEYEIQWPISEGKHKLTLIDSLGKQSHSEVEIRLKQ
ncbi:MAG: penicillin-binding protein 1C [Pseudomonadota bacterium]